MHHTNLDSMLKTMSSPTIKIAKNHAIMELLKVHTVLSILTVLFVLLTMLLTQRKDSRLKLFVNQQTLLLKFQHQKLKNHNKSSVNNNHNNTHKLLHNNIVKLHNKRDQITRNINNNSIKVPHINPNIFPLSPSPYLLKSFIYILILCATQ
jgi:hypothetical protein